MTDIIISAYWRWSMAPQASRNNADWLLKERKHLTWRERPAILESGSRSSLLEDLGREQQPAEVVVSVRANGERWRRKRRRWRRLLRVGASGTDDASTNRLVKQLFGASIRRRVSRRFSLQFHDEGARCRAKGFGERCAKESCANWTVYRGTGNAVYISNRQSRSTKSLYFEKSVLLKTTTATLKISTVKRDNIRELQPSLPRDVISGSSTNYVWARDLRTTITNDLWTWLSLLSGATAA